MDPGFSERAVRIFKEKVWGVAPEALYTGVCILNTEIICTGGGSY